MPAADNLKVANDLIRKNCGKPIPQPNHPLSHSAIIKGSLKTVFTHFQAA
ncbi:hypothetical protein [Kingella sp. (in: b-proteobacteria)]|nr:hypothetical protein [Kingella sp. (in: b-proteobacteria)]MDO4658655.1 hypothetical protein [Kingella sp. (in: b-proteobacteria)]